MVAGCQEWQQYGLSEPERVKEATAKYRTEMDTLAAFIEECCVEDKDVYAKLSHLWDRYKSWCVESGEEYGTKPQFQDSLTERGFKAGRGNGNVAIRWGIALRSDDDPPNGGGDKDDDSVNSGDQKVNPMQYDNDDDKSKETDNTGVELTDTREELIGLPYKGTCKTQEVPEKVNRVNPKTTSFEARNLAIERIGNSVNSVNSVNSKAEQSCHHGVKDGCHLCRKQGRMRDPLVHTDTKKARFFIESA
jgi:hypothetical protein